MLGCAYGRSLDDGAGLDNLLLVQLGTRSVEVANDCGHTGLVAHGGGQVDGLLRVILGEAVVPVSVPSNLSMPCAQNSPLDLTTVAGSALSRQECQRTVTGSLELPVRHGEFDVLWLVSKLAEESSRNEIQWWAMCLR
jgi:hypothetical protein